MLAVSSRCLLLSCHFGFKQSLRCTAKMSQRQYASKSKFVHTPRLQVLLDMDQVLADFEGHLLVKYREKYPDEPFVPLEERNTFHMTEQYGKIRKDLPDKIREILYAENFFRDLPEIEGGVAAAKEIMDMENVDVFICTSNLIFYKYCVGEKYEWAEHHLGPEWINRIIMAKDKTMVRGHLLIDDNPHIIGACKPSWEHIVFTACHNKRTDLKGTRRLDNWTDGSWRDLIDDFKKRI